MLTALVFSAALLVQRQTDTTVAVAAGMRLHANAFGGSISVHAWPKNSVRVSAEHGSRDRVSVRVSEGAVTVESAGRYGPPAAVDYTIDVPEWMPVTLEGVNTDMTVRGTKAAVSAQTVQGDVTVEGGADQINLTSVSGDVRLSGARGRVIVSATNQDVTLRDIVGEISAEAVNGAVLLEGIDASSVEANSVNGDVTYDGTIKDNGHYRFATHSGDVAVSMDEHTNANVSVATFSGEFNSADFPVRLSEVRKGRRFTFTLGTGSARVELESFDGTVSLRRPGAVRSRHQTNHKDKDKDH
ncbi:MAG TPA: DUF4097 family beta strand repeat-containing protein [Gemmatimonadales bacterium]|jgi:DUF4097 and DUF4098 domain-containing protein YvlB